MKIVCENVYFIPEATKMKNIALMHFTPLHFIPCPFHQLTNDQIICRKTKKYTTRHSYIRISAHPRFRSLAATFSACVFGASVAIFHSFRFLNSMKSKNINTDHKTLVSLCLNLWPKFCNTFNTNIRYRWYRGENSSFFPTIFTFVPGLFRNGSIFF